MKKLSPVADIRAIRILIAIAATMTYEIWQMDPQPPSLNGHLVEEQASRQWNKRFDDEIKKFGFTQNPDEPCVYLKASGSYVAILILYVDDILLMGNNISNVYKKENPIWKKLFYERFRIYMENSKRGTIPMQEKLKLSKSQGASTPAEKQRMQNIPYASAIGSIMYLCRYTRTDVAFAHKLQADSTDPELRVSCYTDAGYLTDADNLKSQLILFYAEYIAAFDASKDAVWIRKFISGLGVVPTIEEPINMYYDNTGAIAIAKDHGVTQDKVDIDDNLANPFTKALAFPKHSGLTEKIRMIPASSLIMIPWCLSRINQIVAWPCLK
ncbi:retrotransposon protein, putative, ty1-copia subclass, partial [Tanacetum coccineum]